MPRMTPPTREQLDRAAEHFEKMAATIRAADPERVYTVEVNRETTYADDPYAPASRATADELTVRIEWLPEVPRG